MLAICQIRVSRNDGQDDQSCELNASWVGKFPGSAFARQEASCVLAHMLRLYILSSISVDKSYETE